MVDSISSTTSVEDQLAARVAFYAQRVAFLEAKNNALVDELLNVYNTVVNDLEDVISQRNFEAAIANAEIAALRAVLPDSEATDNGRTAEGT